MLLFVGHLVDFVESVHLIFLDSELDLALLDLIIFVFYILDFSWFSLLELTPRFFYQAIMLDEFLLGKCYLGEQRLLFFLKVSDITLLGLQEFT